MVECVERRFPNLGDAVVLDQIDRSTDTFDNGVSQIVSHGLICSPWLGDGRLRPVTDERWSLKWCFDLEVFSLNTDCC